MKYKSYKDSNVEMTTGLNAELLDKNDIISARSINRPIINILENQETDYNLLQTLLKTVYGDRNGILPDIQEEFIPETFQISSFVNDTNKYFIRLPLGSMFLSKNPNDEFDINDENPFSAQGEYNYKDAYGKDSFLKDKLHSYIVENKPEINLYERQLASFIGLDLTYLDNDIKIYEDMVPFAIKVAIIDEDTKQIKNGPDGSPMYVQDENSNIIYLAKEGEGNLDIFINNTIVNPKNFNVVTTYDKILNSKTASLENDTILQFVDYDENLIVKETENGRYTSDIDKAIVLKDSNGETKYRSGYYLNVVRSTDADNEEVWLPNLSENSNFEIYMPSYTGSKVNIVATIKNEDKIVEEISYTLFDTVDTVTANNNFYTAFYEKSEFFEVKKIQSKLPNDDIIIGTKLVAKSSNSITNNYTISIKYVSPEGISTEVVDAITEKAISDIKITTRSNQRYYDNIFDLTNSFFGKFSSFLANISDLYKYVNFETIIQIPINITNHFFVFCDLENNIDNQLKENYDKSGRFFVANNENDNNPKHIKMFEVFFDESNTAPYTRKIKKVITFFPNLDRRTISTKRAELSTLLVNSRTDLRNYFLLRDNDGNRTIELTENFDNPDNEQTRYASPITRITDKIEISKLEEPDNNTWTDSLNGDTASDFFEEAYPVRDFITNEKYYNQHHDYSNKGIIIDRNKGLKIFNNSGLINHPFSFGDSDRNNFAEKSKIYKKYLNQTENITLEDFYEKIDNFKQEALEYSSYSEYQPLEIISKYGNINILTTDYENSRINIKNLKDSNNNIIDLLGITRARSARKYQLVIRKIGNALNMSSNIAFVTGPSTSKEDTNALNTDKNILAGYLSYETGYFKIQNNRSFKVYINSPNQKEEEYQKLALSIRNTYQEGDYFTSTFNGDIVGKNNNNLIGYPIESRTYKEYEGTNSPFIPYTKDLVEEGININNEGTIDRIEGYETRWLASFIKYGYFGRLTLADTRSDIRNKDERDGALRLGDSNIFDVSSIFINKRNGQINFDNEINNNSFLTENTIKSFYGAPQNDNEGTALDGISFILKRSLGVNINNKASVYNENSNNFFALHITPKGTYINKNLEVTRQVFVNSHKYSSANDNASLVVKGQTVSVGDLVIDKLYNKNINDSNYNEITRNTDDKNKYYDFEFFEKTTFDGDYYEDRGYNEETGEYYSSNKEKNLFTLVNTGKTYLKGNVKIDGIFESNAIFNRSITINNNRVANYPYNSKTLSIPVRESDYSIQLETDNYYNNSQLLPRNNKSFDVVSGKIIFGSNYSASSSKKEKDAADVFINGSEFIRRRLEISEKDSILINTKKVYKNLIDTYTKKNNQDKYVLSEISDSHNSPSLFVNGAAHICGDVVFGKNPRNNDNYYYLPNKKNKPNSNGEFTILDSSSPIKAIFWGANGQTASVGEGATASKDWRTDFDFHGKTWFDNIVKIGSKVNELCYPDSNEAGNKENGNLTIYGKDNIALNVEGSVKISNGQSFDLDNEEIHIKARKGNDYSSIDMAGEEKNFVLKVDNGNKTITADPEKITIEDTTASPIKIISRDSSGGEDFTFERVTRTINGETKTFNTATLNADDEVNVNTKETTIVSGNNVLNSKDNRFISQISNKTSDGNNSKVVSEISQTNENIKLYAKRDTIQQPVGSVEVETYDYILNASKLDENKDILSGSIKENTYNRTSITKNNYFEIDSKYDHASSSEFIARVAVPEANETPNSTRDLSKSIKGNNTSWIITHGTAKETINSDNIMLELNKSNNKKINLTLDNTNDQVTLSTRSNNNYLDNDISLSKSEASLKHNSKYYIDGGSSRITLSKELATIETKETSGINSKIVLNSYNTVEGDTSTISATTALGQLIIGSNQNSIWTEKSSVGIKTNYDVQEEKYNTNLLLNKDKNLVKLNVYKTSLEMFHNNNNGSISLSVVNNIDASSRTNSISISTDGKTSITSFSDLDISASNNNGNLYIHDNGFNLSSKHSDTNDTAMLKNVDGANKKTLELQLHAEKSYLKFETDNNDYTSYIATLLSNKAIKLTTVSNNFLELSNDLNNTKKFTLQDSKNSITGFVNVSSSKIELKNNSNNILSLTDNTTLSAKNSVGITGNNNHSILLGKLDSEGTPTGICLKSNTNIVLDSGTMYIGTVNSKSANASKIDLIDSTIHSKDITLNTQNYKNKFYSFSLSRKAYTDNSGYHPEAEAFKIDSSGDIFFPNANIYFGSDKSCKVYIKNGVLYVDGYSISIS